MDPEPVLIAHISDLHLRGDTGHGSWEAWHSLTKYLVDDLNPHLVTISGDLADTPSREIYQRIGASLEKLNMDLSRKRPDVTGQRVWICAGNHDRHWRGNAIFGRARSDFVAEAKLSRFIPTLEKPHDTKLGLPGNEWRIRLTSVDTSEHSRRSAQAFLPVGIRERIRDFSKTLGNQEGDDPRLVIMLFHHHLLPLPKSEPAQQSVTHLFNMTGAVNPGTILEDIAASHIDLVLHGHEHHVNRSRYASYERETVQVAMVAAGSATGMKTMDGCDLKRASFNLIELRSDRSVWCREIKGPQSNANSTEWSGTGEAIEILDPTTLRQNLFQRTTVQRRTRREHVENRKFERFDGPASEWSKHITITATRDAEVNETRVNWQIVGGRFTVRVQNDNGLPSQPKARLNVRLPPDLPRPKLKGFSPLKGDPGAWSFGIHIDTAATVVATRIMTSYLWQDAIMLTQNDFHLVDLSRCGPHRSNGKEFVAARVDRPLKNLALSASFPPGFMPETRSVKVFSQRAGVSGTDGLEEERSLTDRLQVAGQTIVLNLPFPLHGFRYDIVWEPPPGPRPSASVLGLWALPARETLFAALVDACRAESNGTPWQDCVSVAAYVPAEVEGRLSRFLRCVGWEGPDSNPQRAPESIDMQGAPNPYVAAWWNETVVVTAQGGETVEKRLASGLLGQEHTAAFLPIQLSGDLGPPVVILRVGIDEPRSANRRDTDIKLLQKMLYLAKARAIYLLTKEI